MTHSRNRFALLLFWCGFFLCFSASAASAPQLVLVYAEDPEQVTLTDSQGNPIPVAEGMAVPVGTRVKTKDSAVEFRLDPNGSILRLARNTLFEMTSLQGLLSSTTNMAVLAGKIRMVAAKLAGVKNSYYVTTPTAQAGVRGTDFAVEANASEGDWICVKEGQVQFSVLDSEGGVAKSVLVNAGEFANAKAANFVARKATPEDLADKSSGLDFAKADEAGVPGHTP